MSVGFQVSSPSSGIAICSLDHDGNDKWSIRKMARINTFECNPLIVDPWCAIQEHTNPRIHRHDMSNYKQKSWPINKSAPKAPQAWPTKGTRSTHHDTPSSAADMYIRVNPDERVISRQRNSNSNGINRCFPASALKMKLRSDGQWSTELFRPLPWCPPRPKIKLLYTVPLHVLVR